MQKTKQRVLITGATGFIGRHLLKDIDFSNYDVRLITRSKSPQLKQLYPHFEIYEADLNNLPQLMEAGKNVDTIVNTAAEVRNHAQLEITNIGGTKNLIEVIRQQKIGKVIHLSSVGVAGYQYSSNKLVVSEKSECNPQNEYERTKLASEKLLIDAHKEQAFKLDIIRPTNVFGEENPFNALLGLINHTKNGKPFVFTKDAQVNYVYVKDITLLIGKLLESNEEHGIINIGKSMHLSEFYLLLKSILQTNNKNVLIPGFIVAILNGLGIKKLQTISNEVIYSDDKLKLFFDYPYGEFEGLKRTIEYYKHLNLLA